MSVLALTGTYNILTYPCGGLLLYFVHWHISLLVTYGLTTLESRRPIIVSVKHFKVFLTPSHVVASLASLMASSR